MLNAESASGVQKRRAGVVGQFNRDSCRNYGELTGSEGYALGNTGVKVHSCRAVCRSLGDFGVFFELFNFEFHIHLPSFLANFCIIASF